MADRPVNLGDSRGVGGYVLDRLSPGTPLGDLGLPIEAVLGAVALGVLVVVAPPLWRVLRVGVTVVHELGHAVVGILAGRTFTGLVLRPDMSGHVVTVGRSRGAGRVLTTWAGYPAPALVGTGLVVASWAGWAPPVLALGGLLLLAGLVRVRSLYSGVVMVATTTAVGWLWWRGAEPVQALALLAVGVLLLLGAWRHLGATVGRSGSDSDAAVLGRLTPLPAPLWTGSFVLVLAAASWLAIRVLWGALDGPA